MYECGKKRMVKNTKYIVLLKMRTSQTGVLLQK